MTSAQPMLRGPNRFAVLLLSALAAAAGTGCRGRLTPPADLLSPWPEPQLWGVVPFANESGVSSVDAARAADHFTRQLEAVRGIDTVPVNRVYAALRGLELTTVATPADAARLMRALRLDAVVVGTITAWDPYPPPTLGLAVAVFSDAAGDPPRIEPRELVRARGATAAAEAVPATRPAARASGVFDARNHATRVQLEAYAAGRTEPDSAYGTGIYLMDMELYTQFVSYRLIRDLLGAERARRRQESQGHSHERSQQRAAPGH